jgi:hypothetical protein
MSGVTTLELEFWVEKTDGTKEKATSMRLTDVDFGFTALVQEMVFSVQLTTTNIASVTILDCTFGKLSALLIKTELNNFFRLFTPSINNFLLKKQISLPTHILGLFELTSLTIGYYDSYLYVGYVPVFLNPTK